MGGAIHSEEETVNAGGSGMHLLVKKPHWPAAAIAWLEWVLAYLCI